MALDFRASQTKTSKIISSGSSAGGARLAIYDFSADGSPSGQGNINLTIFPTSSIGSDVFLFVSGGVGAKNVTNANAVAAFGGDVVVSGSVVALTSFSGSHQALKDGTAAFLAGPNVTIQMLTGGAIAISASSAVTTGSIFVPSGGFAYTTASVALDPKTRFTNQLGTDVFFFVSGTIFSVGTATRGAAVFGGDVYTSGALYVSGGFLQFDSPTSIAATVKTTSFTASNFQTSYYLSGTAITCSLPNTVGAGQRYELIDISGALGTSPTLLRMVGPGNINNTTGSTGIALNRSFGSWQVICLSSTQWYVSQ